MVAVGVTPNPKTAWIFLAVSVSSHPLLGLLLLCTSSSPHTSDSSGFQTVAGGLWGLLNAEQKSLA